MERLRHHGSFGAIGAQSKKQIVAILPAKHPEESMTNCVFGLWSQLFGPKALICVPCG
jgi:hypothetical protein